MHVYIIYRSKQNIKTMDRSIPVFNRLIVEKIQRNDQKLHKERLESIRNSTSNSPSRKGKVRSLQSNIVYKVIDRKGMMFEEQKRTEIERHNIILFNRMNKIMNRSQKQSQILNHTISLTGESRLRQNFMTKVYNQNKLLVDRIERQRPSISNRKFMEDRIRNQKILKSMRKYPYQNNTFDMNTLIREDDQNRDMNEVEQIEAGQSSANRERKYQRTADGTFRVRRNSKDQNFINANNNQRGTNQQILTLYVQKKQNKRIEIKRLRNNKYELKMILFVKKGQQSPAISQQVQSIYLTEAEGNELFMRCNYDYRFIAACLHRAANGKLTLRIPKSMNHQQQKDNFLLLEDDKNLQLLEQYNKILHSHEKNSNQTYNKHISLINKEKQELENDYEEIVSKDLEGI